MRRVVDRQAVIQDFTEAWNSGDPAIDDFLAPDFRFIGDPMHLGVSLGRISIQQMRDEIPGSVRLTIRELIDLDGGRVLTLGMAGLSNERGDYAQQIGWIITVDDEGRLVSTEGFADHAAARQAAGVESGPG